MTYGLAEALIDDVQAYLLGDTKVPLVPYQEDGNWERFLPKYEPQAEDYETNGCTVWGTQNQIETFYKRVFKTEPNYSERFNYLLTPVDPNGGADPHKVYENIRAHGLIDHKDLPVTRTKEQFLDKSDITGSLRAQGQFWLKRHELKHEWVWRPGVPPENWRELLKEALHYSPVGVSVTAWREQMGKYVDNGQRNNHWCMAYRFDAEGIHVFDSYDHSKKILGPINHTIRFAKRIHIVRKDKRGALKQRNLLQKILDAILMKDITLLDVCKKALGTDASPNDKAPDELGCAETVTTLLKKLYPETPIITGTWTLWEYLKDHKNGWIPTNDYEPESIVISPTGTGHKGAVGHVGIVGENGIIMSNDSGVANRANKGKFLANYTIETWTDRYRTRNGMPVYLFKRK